MNRWYLSNDFLDMLWRFLITFLVLGLVFTR